MDTLDNNSLQPQSNPSSFSFVLKWAILLALIEIVFSLITYLTGLMLNPYIKWIMTPIIFVVALFATQNFRNKEMGGFISFGKGFGISFQTIFYAGIITTIYTYIFFKFIDHGMIDQMMQMARQGMVDKGLPDEQIEMGLKYTRMLMSPGALSIITLIGGAFMGAILSLIVAAICKKENNVLLPPQ